MTSAWAETASGLLLPNLPEPTPVGIDLFAGAGGFSLGMEQGGIDVVAAVESNYAAAATYLLNLGRLDGCAVAYDSAERQEGFRRYLNRKPRGVEAELDRRLKDPGGSWVGSGWRLSEALAGNEAATRQGVRAFYLGDACRLRGQQLLELAGLDSVDVVFGGPPCQGLSMLNPKRCVEDPRNQMLWEFLRLVDELRPRAFVIENVPQLLTISDGSFFEALKKRAIEVGYDVVASVLDAVNYGVPQYRRRAFVVGTEPGRTAQWAFPVPTHWQVGETVDGNSWGFRRAPDSPEAAQGEVAQLDLFSVVGGAES